MRSARKREKISFDFCYARDNNYGDGSPESYRVGRRTFTTILMPASNFTRARESEPARSGIPAL